MLGKKLKFQPDFPEAFKGFIGSKEDFKNYCLKNLNDSIETPSYDDLKARSASLSNSSSDPEDTIPSISQGKQAILNIEKNSSILQVSIIGKSEIDIADLIKKLNNSDWVKQGIEYYDKTNKRQCPFCQKKTSEDFSKSLTEYFDKTFAKQLKDIESLKGDYDQYSKALIAILENVIVHKFIKKDDLNQNLQNLKIFFESNKKSFREKINAPSQNIKLKSTEAILINLEKIINEANKAIGEHNKILAERKTEKKKFIDGVCRYIQTELKSEIKKYEKDQDNLSKVIDEHNEEIRCQKGKKQILENEISQLENSQNSIHSTMSKINQLLKSCGINSFSLAKHNIDHYQLIRSDGTSASETISEGEKTLITFLYFYHLLCGSDKNTSARGQIVVFDDPISSLDSNILQFVSGLLYEIFVQAAPETDSEKQRQDHHIKQCFLLTHNLYFYKMVTGYWVKYGKPNKPKQDTSFWTIYKTDQGSNIEQCLKNPVKSSYELLWEEIHRKNKSSIANTIRRILESYFLQMVGLSLRDLPNQFDDANEKNIVRFHIAWIHQGSHSINDDLYYFCTDEVMEMQLKIFLKKPITFLTIIKGWVLKKI